MTLASAELAPAKNLGRAGGRWRSQLRYWLVIVLIVGLGTALTYAASQTTSSNALDPDSTGHAGSHALAVLLAQRGSTVHRIGSPAQAPEGSTLVLIYPNDYTADELSGLAKTHRLVLVAPTEEALSQLGSTRVEDDSADSGIVDPGCDAPYAAATGAVDFPDGDHYSASPCYEGRVSTEADVVVLGSELLLTNAYLGDLGVAALTINLLSDDGRVSDIYWSMDTSTASPSNASVWSLFPDWMPHLVWGLALVAIAIMFWQGRRLGPVVSEPLPVVVRSVEVVEGHGRLYRRAKAIHRCAQILRQSATRALAVELGLSAETDAVTVAATLNTPLGDRLLLGPLPDSESELLEFATGLAELDSAVSSHWTGSADDPAI